MEAPFFRTGYATHMKSLRDNKDNGTGMKPIGKPSGIIRIMVPA
jgi:hypothetical protein